MTKHPFWKIALVWLLLPSVAQAAVFSPQVSVMVVNSVAVPSLEVASYRVDTSANTVAWNTTTPAVTQGYEVQQSTTSDFSSGITTSGWTTALTLSFLELTSNTEYCYRVRARSIGLQETSWSSVSCTYMLASRDATPSDIGDPAIAVVIAASALAPRDTLAAIADAYPNNTTIIEALASNNALSTSTLSQIATPSNIANDAVALALAGNSSASSETLSAIAAEQHDNAAVLAAVVAHPNATTQIVAAIATPTNIADENIALALAASPLATPTILDSVLVAHPSDDAIENALLSNSATPPVTFTALATTADTNNAATAAALAANTQTDAATLTTLLASHPNNATVVAAIAGNSSTPIATIESISQNSTFIADATIASALASQPQVTESVLEDIVAQHSDSLVVLTAVAQSSAATSAVLQEVFATTTGSQSPVIVSAIAESSEASPQLLADIQAAYPMDADIALTLAENAHTAAATLAVIATTDVVNDSSIALALAENVNTPASALLEITEAHPTSSAVVLAVLENSNTTTTVLAAIGSQNSNIQSGAIAAALADNIATPASVLQLIAQQPQYAGSTTVMENLLANPTYQAILAAQQASSSVATTSSGSGSTTSSSTTSSSTSSTTHSSAPTSSAATSSTPATNTTTTTSSTNTTTTTTTSSTSTSTPTATASTADAVAASTAPVVATPQTTTSATTTQTVPVPSPVAVESAITAAAQTVAAAQQVQSTTDAAKITTITQETSKVIAAAAATNQETQVVAAELTQAVSTIAANNVVSASTLEKILAPVSTNTGASSAATLTQVKQTITAVQSIQQKAAAGNADIVQEVEILTKQGVKIDEVLTTQQVNTLITQNNFSASEVRKQVSNNIFSVKEDATGNVYIEEKTIGQKDSDNDGLSDAHEASIGSNPFVADTDSDGRSDGEEVLLFGTKPLTMDSDTLVRGITNISDTQTLADSRPVFKGVAEAGAQLTLQAVRNGVIVPLGSVTADSRGTWLMVPENELSDGSYDLQVLNDAGEVVQEKNITIDLAFVLPPPTLLAARGATGSSDLVSGDALGGDADLVFHEVQPVFYGNTYYGSTVIANFQSVLMSTSIIADNPSGDFEVSPPKELPVGNHTLTLYSELPDGTRSSAQVIKFTVVPDGFSIGFSASEAFTFRTLLLGLMLINGVAALYIFRDQLPRLRFLRVA